MATKSKKRAKNAGTRLFFGKMWKNKIRKKGSDFRGQSFFRLTIDNKINGKKVKEAVLIVNGEEYDLTKSNIVGFPNEKREDMRDADFRLSLAPREDQDEDDDDEDDEDEDDDD